MTTPPTSDGPQPPVGGQPDAGRPWQPAPPPGQQPPWGGYAPPAGAVATAPAAQPRDRRRTLLIAALVAVGLAIAAGAGLLFYVLSSTRLDPERVARDVAAQFEEQHRVAIDLECDRVMIVRPGADHECEGTTADGEEVELLITVTDEQGNYTWAEDD